jgi:hypothetical protein
VGVQAAQPAGHVGGRDARAAQGDPLGLDLVEGALEGGVDPRQARLGEADALGDAGELEGDLRVGQQLAQHLGALLDPAGVGGQAAAGVGDAELGARGDGVLEVPGEVVELAEQVAEALGVTLPIAVWPASWVVRKPSSRSSSAAKPSSMPMAATALRPRSERA